MKKIVASVVVFILLVLVSNYFVYLTVRASYYEVGQNDGAIEEKITIVNMFRDSHGLLDNCRDVKKEDLGRRFISVKDIDLYFYKDLDVDKLCIYE